MRILYILSQFFKQSFSIFNDKRKEVNKQRRIMFASKRILHNYNKSVKKLGKNIDDRITQKIKHSFNVFHEISYETHKEKSQE